MYDATWTTLPFSQTALGSLLNIFSVRFPGTLSIVFSNSRECWRTTWNKTMQCGLSRCNFHCLYSEVLWIHKCFELFQVSFDLSYPILAFAESLKTSITQMPRLLESNKKFLPATLISSFSILSPLQKANSWQRQIEHFRGCTCLYQYGAFHGQRSGWESLVCRGMPSLIQLTTDPHKC